MSNGARTGGHNITLVFCSDNGIGDVSVFPRVVEPSPARRFVVLRVLLPCHILYHVLSLMRFVCDLCLSMMIVNDEVVAVLVPSAIAGALGRDMAATVAEHSSATLPVHMEWDEWPGVTITVLDMEEEEGTAGVGGLGP